MTGRNAGETRSPGLGSGLLSRPAAESVRRILLLTLDRIEEAADRLRDGSDLEALHDFRVGLRRLRSLLRAFRTVVAEDLPGRAENRVRAMARATNRGRDAEVQAALLRVWLQGSAKNATSAAARRAVLGLAVELERQRDEHSVSSIAEARRDFTALARNLRQRLLTYRVTVELENGERQGSALGGAFGGELARQVRTRWGNLRDGAGALEGIDPPELLHRVRIDAKRLRYLLEPLRDEAPEVGALLQVLRTWQDLLGEFQDAVVLERRVAKRYVIAVRERTRALLEEARKRGSAGASARARQRVPVSPRGFLPLLDWARERQLRSWSGLRRRLAELPALGERIERLCAQWSALEGPASPAGEPASVTPG